MFHVPALLLCMTCTQYLCTNDSRILVYEDKFQRVPDGKERIICAEETIAHNGNQNITLQYTFSQRSLIENNLTNNVTAPTSPPPADIPVKIPSWNDIIRDQIGDYLWNPLAYATVACGAYLLYCIRSKLSLYTLGKACIEKAVWSLWKNNITGDDLDEQDTDTTLLIQILHTYGSENYTEAIARFLQDVDAETELLTSFVAEAIRAQGSLVKFLFDDLPAQLKEAQDRLVVLGHLKEVVMRWLQPKKDMRLEETLFVENVTTLTPPRYPNSFAHIKQRTF